MRSVILVSELLHKVDQCLDSLVWHGVVYRSAAATDRPVPLELDEPSFGRLLEELSLEFIVLFDAEGDVHAGAVAGVHGVGKVVRGAVY